MRRLLRSRPLLEVGRAVAEAVAAGSAAVVLLGWLLAVPALEYWIPGRPTMKANSVLAILLLAGALAVRRRRLVSALLASIAGAVALLSLVEIGFGTSLGIDQLLFHERPGAIGTTSPGQMSPVAASTIAVLSVAIVLIGCRSARHVLVGQLVAVLAFLGALTSVLAVAADTSQLLAFGHTTVLSVPTAVALLALALAALLARPDVGVTASLVRRGFDGFVLRASLCAAVVVPIAFGGVREAFRSAGLEATAAEWLYTVLIVAAFGAFAWILARLLGNAISDYTVAAERLHGIVEHSPLAVVTLDPEGDVVSWNPGAEQMLGWRADEVVGRPYPLARGQELAEVRGELAAVAAGRQLLLEQLRHRKDGS